MAMSGNITSNKITNNYFIDISWSASYNTEAMIATISISSVVRQDPRTSYPNRVFKIYGSASDNYININGTDVFTTAASGSGSQSNPYNCYTNINATVVDRSAYSSNFEGGPAWVYCRATLISNYVFTVPINDDGYCTFTVSAKGYCSGGTMTIGSTTISTTPTEVGSRIGNKSNGSWNSNARIWHKENGNWVKKFLYRKESGNWNRK